MEWYWSWSSNTWPPDAKTDSLERPWCCKRLKAGGEQKMRTGTAEDEMVGWHHQLDGHEFEQAPGIDGQGSLVCWIPWGLKDAATTEWLNCTGMAYPCVAILGASSGKIQSLVLITQLGSHPKRSHPSHLMSLDSSEWSVILKTVSRLRHLLEWTLKLRTSYISASWDHDSLKVIRIQGTKNKSSGE